MPLGGGQAKLQTVVFLVFSSTISVVISLALLVLKKKFNNRKTPKSASDSPPASEIAPKASTETLCSTELNHSLSENIDYCMCDKDISSDVKSTGGGDEKCDFHPEASFGSDSLNRSGSKEDAGQFCYCKGENAEKEISVDPYQSSSVSSCESFHTAVCEWDTDFPLLSLSPVCLSKEQCSPPQRQDRATSPFSLDFLNFRLLSPPARRFEYSKPRPVLLHARQSKHPWSRPLSPSDTQSESSSCTLTSLGYKPKSGQNGKTYSDWDSNGHPFHKELGRNHFRETIVDWSHGRLKEASNTQKSHTSLKSEPTISSFCTTCAETETDSKTKSLTSSETCSTDCPYSEDSEVKVGKEKCIKWLLQHHEVIENTKRSGLSAEENLLNIADIPHNLLFSPSPSEVVSLYQNSWQRRFKFRKTPLAPQRLAQQSASYCSSRKSWCGFQELNCMTCRCAGSFIRVRKNPNCHQKGPYSCGNRVSTFNRLSQERILKNTTQPWKPLPLNVKNYRNRQQLLTSGGSSCMSSVTGLTSVKSCSSSCIDSSRNINFPRRQFSFYNEKCIPYCTCLRDWKDKKRFIKKRFTKNYSQMHKGRRLSYQHITSQTKLFSNRNYIGLDLPKSTVQVNETQKNPQPGLQNRSSATTLCITPTSFSERISDCTSDLCPSSLSASNNLDRSVLTEMKNDGPKMPISVRCKKLGMYALRYLKCIEHKLLQSECSLPPDVHKELLDQITDMKENQKLMADCELSPLQKCEAFELSKVEEPRPKSLDLTSMDMKENQRPVADCELSPLQKCEASELSTAERPRLESLDLAFTDIKEALKTLYSCKLSPSQKCDEDKLLQKPEYVANLHCPTEINKTHQALKDDEFSSPQRCIETKLKSEKSKTVNELKESLCLFGNRKENAKTIDSCEFSFLPKHVLSQNENSIGPLNVEHTKGAVTSQSDCGSQQFSVSQSHENLRDEKEKENVQSCRLSLSVSSQVSFPSDTTEELSRSFTVTEFFVQLEKIVDELLKLLENETPKVEIGCSSPVLSDKGHEQCSTKLPVENSVIQKVNVLSMQSTQIPLSPSCAIIHNRNSQHPAVIQQLNSLISTSKETDHGERKTAGSNIARIFSKNTSPLKKLQIISPTNDQVTPGTSDMMREILASDTGRDNRMLPTIQEALLPNMETVSEKDTCTISSKLTNHSHFSTEKESRNIITPVNMKPTDRFPNDISSELALTENNSASSKCLSLTRIHPGEIQDGGAEKCHPTDTKCKVMHVTARQEPTQHTKQANTRQEPTQHTIQVNARQEPVQHTVQANTRQDSTQHIIQVNTKQEPIQNTIQVNATEESAQHTMQSNTKQEPTQHTMQVNIKQEPIQHSMPINTKQEPTQHSMPINTKQEPTQHTMQVNTKQEPTQHSMPINTKQKPNQHTIQVNTGQELTHHDTEDKMTSRTNFSNLGLRDCEERCHNVKIVDGKFNERILSLSCTVKPVASGTQANIQESSSAHQPPDGKIITPSNGEEKISKLMAVDFGIKISAWAKAMLSGTILAYKDSGGDKKSARGGEQDDCRGSSHPVNENLSSLLTRAASLQKIFLERPIEATSFPNYKVGIGSVLGRLYRHNRHSIPIAVFQVINTSERPPCQNAAAHSLQVKDMPDPRIKSVEHGGKMRVWQPHGVVATFESSFPYDRDLVLNEPKVCIDVSRQSCLQTRSDAEYLLSGVLENVTLRENNSDNEGQASVALEMVPSLTPTTFRNIFYRRFCEYHKIVGPNSSQFKM